MSVPVQYRPSPLGYGSPPSRNSPFRRPESPASPSPLRQSNATPNGSPAPASGQNRSGRHTTPGTPRDPRTATQQAPASSSPRYAMPSQSALQQQQPQGSASHGAAREAPGHGNALSSLPPAQVTMLRDSFQILDRDCDGVVNREDVADMLNQLGLPSDNAYVSRLFPPSAPQTMGLAMFLSSMAESLSAMTPSAELLSAFSAFDEDDSGQVDVAELRDALLNTAPDAGERPLSPAEVDKVMNGFTGRRAFNRNMNAQLGAKRGNVLKYQELVSSVMGAQGGSESESHVTSEG